MAMAMAMSMTHGNPPQSVHTTFCFTTTVHTNPVSEMDSMDHPAMDMDMDADPKSILDLLADTDEDHDHDHDVTAPQRRGFGRHFIDFWTQTIHDLIRKNQESTLKPVMAPPVFHIFPEPPADLILSPYFASINKATVGPYADYMTGNLSAWDYAEAVKAGIESLMRSQSQFAEADIHPTDPVSVNVAAHLWSLLNPLFVTPPTDEQDGDDLAYRLASQLVNVYPLETEPATEIADETEFWEFIHFLLFTLQFQTAKHYLDANRNVHGRHTDAVKDLIDLVEKADPTGISTRTSKSTARLASLPPTPNPTPLHSIYALLAGQSDVIPASAPCWRTALSALLIFSTPRLTSRAQLWTYLPRLAHIAVQSAPGNPHVPDHVDFLAQLLVCGSFSGMLAALVHAGDLWLATHLAPLIWRTGPRDVMHPGDVQRVLVSYVNVLANSPRMGPYANAYFAAARCVPEDVVGKNVLDYVSVALVHALGRCKYGDDEERDLWLEAPQIAQNPVVMKATWNPVLELARREERRGRRGWAAKAFAIARAWRQVDRVVRAALAEYVQGVAGVEVLQQFDVVGHAEEKGKTLVGPVRRYVEYYDEYGQGVGEGVDELRRMAQAQVELMNEARWPWFFVPTLLLETLPLLSFSYNLHPNGLNVLTCLLNNCQSESLVSRELEQIGVNWNTVEAQLMLVVVYRNQVSAFTPSR
ncbi:hypothetical protein BCR44DRAFT_1442863, partial [Catenaria anguillulae PL171]